ncbi:S-layer homology domain-containing protein [Paenibacillus assamensis]|uniref:S-layer homology domain-containing protein n=1 Tax=Paenibacillus assamensis TaxID=311244 RepID=UPI0004297C9D|nr:S-layer homology domain-containing protein [Paenibacillus assamensis]
MMNKRSLAAITALTVVIGGSVPVSLMSADSVSAAEHQLTANQGKATMSDNNKKFTDTAGHWAEGAIYEAVKRGYVTGYPSGKFLPNHKVTRAEFVKMAVSALNLPVGSSLSDSWYVKYVDAAKSSGIFATGDFADADWNKPLTREEMAKVAVRALGSVTKVEENQWMYLAAKNGIISGTSPGEISPNGATTRAQAISVIERMLKVKNGEKLPADKYAVAAAEVFWHKTNIFTVASEIFNGPDNKNIYSGIRSWKISKLRVASPNGNIVGQVDSLIAIDWNDPKDPNRKLLPSKDKLLWRIGAKTKVLGDDMDAYIVLLQSSILVNKDPKRYPFNELALGIRGYNGKPDINNFNQPALLESKDQSRQINGLVIPKNKFSTKGEIQIEVETISIGAPIYSNVLSTSVLIK